MQHRKLTENEIEQLQNQGCRSETWSKIEVTNNFQATRVQHVVFSGENYLGAFNNTTENFESINKPTGIYNCHLHNCCVADNVSIYNVNMLSNYKIEENVIIENVNALVVAGETSFGNGTPIDVLNEAGGRSIKIFDQLTAQLAYFMILYRHNHQLQKELVSLVDKYVESVKSNRGLLQKECRIQNCGTILNVNVGRSALILGAQKLEEGTIISCKEAPTTVGTGVIAKRFIILSGSKIDESVILTSSFIGQSVKMGKQYSAENSAFFANSELYHGEGCSVFGGPYTVSHHKSTLLIAGFYSFFNAGSGTNQSNHMYKLGPVHQGILERGSKTGSFSYLLWPSRTGPFTNVIGKHYTNFDTTDLPFSFINEEGGRSVVVPGMNLFTVGTRRDSMKWPARDNRKDPQQFDLINFNVFSPYVVGKMVRSISQLKELYDKASKKQEYINYQGISINRLIIRTAIKYYEIGIKIYIGDTLIHYLENITGKFSIEKLRKKLMLDSDKELPIWTDVAGLLAPQNRIDQVLSSVVKGEIISLQQLQQSLHSIHASYEDENMNWCARLIFLRLNIEPKELTVDHIKDLVTDWKTSSLKLNNLILQDAAKEFGPSATIGYGHDRDDKEQKQDFETVRGHFEENKFVKSVEADSKRIEQTNERIQTILDQISKRSS